MQKTKGDTFDLRAEEDAARRLNVGKAITTNSSMVGLKSRSKKTDLIGKAALKERVSAIAKNHGIKIEQEATLYLLSTIEQRIKTLIENAIKAQQHRTLSNHYRQPPITSKRRNGGKAIWSTKINNDNNQVIDQINKIYREEEQDFRKSRMSRLAKEAELQKIKERSSSLQPSSFSADFAFQENGGGPSTPISKPPLSSAYSTPMTSDKPGGGGGGTPTFGAIKDSTTKSGQPIFGASLKKSGSSSSSSSLKNKMNPRDVSAEVQHKMANATAMRSVGMGKKYGWMTGNIPNVSSPLASSGAGSSNSSPLGSKKRKADKEKDKEKEKSKLRESSVFNESEKDDSVEPPPLTSNNNVNASTPTSISESENKDKDKDKERPNKKLKPSATLISQPTRRLILIDKEEKNSMTSSTSTSSSSINSIGLGIGIGLSGLGGTNSNVEKKEKRIEDDKVLTLVDLVFALEHNGLGGNGLGNEDEILKKIWSAKGGPWGEDGWDGRK
ncbi:uncharacterized protein L201_002415 [Kwoniella dendrophila CBS 6074]|uniref:Transcription initiation factor TFIID subunit 4 n=1 Tax=Kwoniella dendrophila CBS 6074 TaxID=1295534 RepID=A0AAX4JSE5_9TREE